MSFTEFPCQLVAGVIFWTTVAGGGTTAATADQRSGRIAPSLTEATMIEYLSTLSGVDLAFYLFLTFMSILAVIATAVSCWPVR
jgi:hypothetical protein